MDDININNYKRDIADLKERLRKQAGEQTVRDESVDDLFDPAVEVVVIEESTKTPGAIQVVHGPGKSAKPMSLEAPTPAPDVVPTAAELLARLEHHERERIRYQQCDNCGRNVYPVTERLNPYNEEKPFMWCRSCTGRQIAQQRWKDWRKRRGLSEKDLLAQRAERRRKYMKKYMAQYRAKLKQEREAEVVVRAEGMIARELGIEGEE